MVHVVAVGVVGAVAAGVFCPCAHPPTLHGEGVVVEVVLIIVGVHRVAVVHLLSNEGEVPKIVTPVATKYRWNYLLKL